MISLHLNLPNTGIMVRWRSPWTYIIHNQNRMYVTGTTYQVLSHGYTCYFKQITALYSPASLPCYHSPTRSLALPAGKILFTLSWDKWLTKCLNTSSIGSFRFWKYSFFSPITLPDITSELSVVPLCDTVEPLSWRNLWLIEKTIESKHTNTARCKCQLFKVALNIFLDAKWLLWKRLIEI